MSLWVFKSYLTAVGEHGRDEIDDWYKALPLNAQARCPFRKSLVSIFAGQREEWEGMLT